MLNSNNDVDDRERRPSQMLNRIDRHRRSASAASAASISSHPTDGRTRVSPHSPLRSISRSGSIDGERHRGLSDLNRDEDLRRKRSIDDMERRNEAAGVRSSIRPTGERDEERFSDLDIDIDLSNIQFDQEGFLNERRVDAAEQDRESWQDLERDFQKDMRRSPPKKESKSWFDRSFAYFKAHMSSFVLAVFFLIIAAFLFFGKNTTKLYGVGLSIWFSFISVMFVALVVSTLLEHFIMHVSGKLLKRAAWRFRMVVRSFSGCLRYIIMFVALDYFILRYWFQLGYEASGEPEALDKLGILVDIMKCGYIIAFCVALNRILIKSLVDGICRRTYMEDIIEVVLMEDTLVTLCCKDVEERNKIGSYREGILAGDNFHAMTKRVRKKLALPLKRKQNSDMWKYSKEYVVDIGTIKEMAIISEVIFDHLDSDKNDTIVFSEWKKYFLEFEAAKWSFQILMDSDSIRRKEVKKPDFIMALNRFFKRRAQLSASFSGLDNLQDVISSIFSTLFYFIMIFIIADQLGYNANQLVVSFSAFALSFSFALGSTIRMFVESIMFVFGTKPYEVGDRVEVDDITYIVESIHLFTTHFMSTENKFVMAPNYILAQKTIVNLRRSKSASICLNVDAAWDVSVETIDKLRGLLLQFLKKHSAVWLPRVEIFLSNPEKCCSIQLSIYVQNRLNWQEAYSIAVEKTRLVHEICGSAKKLGIRFKQPTLPVSLSK